MASHLPGFAPLLGVAMVVFDRAQLQLLQELAELVVERPRLAITPG